MKPTSKQYGAFEKMYEYLNRALFDNRLPDCMLRFTGRGKKTDGYFAPASWSENGVDLKHEISINPRLLGKRDKKEILAVICHNMVHLWQFTFCQTVDSSREYHGKKWAEKMELIGLIPSQTGIKGGKKTGKKISQYIQPGGVFEQVCSSMPDGFLLPFRSSGKSVSDSQKREKITYLCPICQTKFWGKPGLQVICNHRGLQSFSQELHSLIDKIPDSSAHVKQHVANLIEKYGMIAQGKKLSIYNVN